ncbi:MAG: hypothetical protein ACKPCI_03720 [Dolichospermum sp.]
MTSLFNDAIKGYFLVIMPNIQLKKLRKHGFYGRICFWSKGLFKGCLETSKLSCQGRF